MVQTLLELDGNILLFIQEHLRHPVLTAVLSGITRLGDGGIFWIVLTLALLIFARTRKAGLCSAIALICTTLIAIVFLKNIVNRVRPYEVIEGLVLIGPKQTDASFPSGHAAIAFACSTALQKHLKKPYEIVLMVLAVVIALSRLYIGVHYPSDVLVGTLIGIACGLASSRLGEKIWDWALSRWKKGQNGQNRDS